jgi:hypothetical protein
LVLATDNTLLVASAFGQYFARVQDEPSILDVFVQDGYVFTLHTDHINWRALDLPSVPAARYP